MGQFENEIDVATERAERRRARQPRAVAAHYDDERGRIVIDLSTGYALAFAPERAQDLAGAHPADLADIEITPSGYGLHFPRLDADLWLPTLMEGVFGSRAWMAAQMGARGGHARSKAKTVAARANGRLGGRPSRKATVKRAKTVKRAAARKPRRLSKRRTQRAPQRSLPQRG
jgi:Protein of unknown function (DUF2442)